MIDLYTANTPNGRKIHIALEELALPYQVHKVNLGAGEQHKPEFLAISPGNKIPAIVDGEGPNGAPISIFESGAILLYLAEKTCQLLSSEPERRWQAVQWLMFQMGGVGPMLGQAGHFLHRAPEQLPYAVDRYLTEAEHLFGVVDRRLADHEYLAGEYSIADIACYPWIAIAGTRLGLDMDDFPNVERWMAMLQQRPAVQKGMALLEG